MRRNETYNQAVEGDEGFIPGEGYPSCDGQPCVNMAEQGDPMTDTMAGEQPLGTVEGAPGSDSQYAAADGSQPRTEAEEERAEMKRARSAHASHGGGKGEPVSPGRPVSEAEKLAEEAAVWKDRCLRLQAEFDNFRKRTLREKMELVESGGADVLKAMLPVVDDVHRAVAAMEKSDDIEALRKGVRLIAQKCDETLRQRGVTPIEALGLELDTDRHEAVARFAAGEEQKGRIVDVIQTGYMLGDKVLRYAKVVVGE